MVSQNFDSSVKFIIYIFVSWKSFFSDLLAEDDLSDDDLNSKEEASKMRKAEFDVTKNKIKGLLNKFCELNPNREQNGYVNGKRSYPVKVKTEKKSDEEETITISSSEEEDQPVRAGFSNFEIYSFYSYHMNNLIESELIVRYCFKLCFRNPVSVLR